MSHSELLCFCGSGKKYFQCHTKFEGMQEPSDRDLHNVDQYVPQERVCYAPDFLRKCNGKIIRSHTIQKKGSLSFIADNGHVIGVKFGDKYNNHIRFDKIGINKASTFYGFCQHHDKAIFKPIEDVDFIASPMQCFLMCFRALCFELYKSRGAVINNDYRDLCCRGQHYREQLTIHENVRRYNAETKSKIHDLEILKRWMDSSISKGVIPKNFAFTVIEYNEQSPFHVSAVISPEYDFEGRQLLELSDLSSFSDRVMISTIPLERKKGCMVLGWNSSFCGASESFVNSFVDQTKLLGFDVLLQSSIILAENIYLNPSWWESLGSHRDVLNDMLEHNIQDYGLNSLKDIQSSGLFDSTEFRFQSFGGG
ncbi:hypothetical protein KS4_07770 [Poriferisphaera corsica]|uniref:Uncharacterized protein n=1 Tax=Poriferisphaera corsica TaxID=2528020 RepID=A0A517YR87_9BACT|nr:hypothetical protein [Poriferisphaera corsica]QDU32743.1 hypothetical protein KS4_07770 [Poriferisphaera corsica]